MDAVMIVDDDPALLELLTDYLGRLGYRVIGVSDGRQAGRAMFADPSGYCSFVRHPPSPPLIPKDNGNGTAWLHGGNSLRNSRPWPA